MYVCCVCGRYSSDIETKPHSIELSIIVSQDCDHASTTDTITTFYRHNITHIKVLCVSVHPMPASDALFGPYDYS